MNFDFDFIQEEHHRLQAFSSYDYDFFEQINFDHHRSAKKEKHNFVLALRRRFQESSSDEVQESSNSMNKGRVNYKKLIEITGRDTIFYLSSTTV